MKIITLVGVPGSIPRTRSMIPRSTDDTLVRGNQWYVQARSIDSRQGRFGDSIISCIVFNKTVNCKLFTLETLKSFIKLVKWVHALQIELEFGSVGFWAGELIRVPGENLSEQGIEPTTNSCHIWRRCRDINPGQIGGKRALSPLHHPCSRKENRLKQWKPAFKPVPAFPVDKLRSIVDALGYYSNGSNFSYRVYLKVEEREN